MELGWGSYGFGFLAGVLSILSPCVLPLVPIVVGTAVAAHPLGTLALAAGLTLSFAGIGLFVATIGFAIGLDAEWFRAVAAVLLICFGVVMLSGWLQRRFSGATASLGSLGDQWLRRIRVEGLSGQLIVGLLLGLVWAPCVGPTLGAAATLASQGGSASRRFFATSKGNLLRLGVHGKYLLGGMMVALGVLILVGWDKSLEAYLVDVSPPWLTELTTRF